MGEIHDEMIDNCRDGQGPCEMCPASQEHPVDDRHVHPGFFNYEADLMFIDEQPNTDHFEYNDYTIHKDYDWYRNFFEPRIVSEDTSSWGLFEYFLLDIFEPLGYSRDEIPELVYSTSTVKCPTKEYDFVDVESAWENCQSYLEREIEEVQPELVVTVGNLAMENALRILGVPNNITDNLLVSEDYGKFFQEADYPTIVSPHYRNRFVKKEDYLPPIRDAVEDVLSS
jgi:uracil-DNA glycosylase